MRRGKAVRHRESCAAPGLGRIWGRERRRKGGAAPGGDRRREEGAALRRVERRRSWGGVADGREVRRIRAARFGWDGFGSGLGSCSVVVVVVVGRLGEKPGAEHRAGKIRRGGDSD